MRNPARVTTNDGTPTFAMTVPWSKPITAHARTATTIATRPLSPWLLVDSEESRR